MHILKNYSTFAQTTWIEKIPVGVSTWNPVHPRVRDILQVRENGFPRKIPSIKCVFWCHNNFSALSKTSQIQMISPCVTQTTQHFNPHQISCPYHKLWLVEIKEYLLGCLLNRFLQNIYILVHKKQGIVLRNRCFCFLWQYDRVFVHCSYKCIQGTDMQGDQGKNCHRGLKGGSGHGQGLEISENASNIHGAFIKDGIFM